MADDSQTPDIANIVSGAISVLGVAVLSFLLGSYVTEFKTFPYPQLLERPYKALKARAERQKIVDHSPKNSIWWKPASKDKKGIVEHDPEKAYNGYTVWSSMESAAWLIDMEGNTLHEWRMPFNKAWPDPPHVDDPVKEKAIKWSGAHVFPNGDLLANYTAHGDTPYGYGLIKLDKDSNIIWKYPGHVHHDFTIDEDGSIWTLIHEFRDLSSDPVEGMPKKFKGQRILEDEIVHLSADGEVLETINLTEAAVDSDFRDKMAKWHRGKRWDLLHTNTVEPISAAFARHHDFAEPGQLLVSFREPSAIALVDRETKRVEWFTNGFWVKQHDPDALDNGNILIFDNQGYRGPAGASRVAEFNPANGEIVWSYAGTADKPFETKWGGKQVMVPNGNVIATENLKSRIFEVNRDGEIVWEFYNPFRAEADGKEYMATFSGRVQRVLPDDLNFLD
jgi:hypothetical protein